MKAAVILSVFYLCYKLLLSKDTLHRLNRIILLCSAVLSFLLPICVLTFHKVIEVPSIMGATEIFEQAAINSDDAVFALTDGPHNFNWEMMLFIIYCIGAAFVLTKMGLGIIRVRRIIRNGNVRKIGEDDIVVTDVETAPFSWMHWIVMSNEDFDKEENSVRIELKKDGNGDYRCYVLNGNVSFDDIIGAISGVGNNDGAIDIEIAAPSDLNCGPVEDIKDELRKLPGIKIKYSLTDREEDGTETEKIPERPAYVKTSTGMDIYKIDDIKNLIIIKINPNDKVLFESGVIELEELEAKVAEAMGKDHPLQINLQIDRGTSYGAYVLAQKSIYNAVSSVRDDYAMEHYGKHYIELDEMESLATRERIPLNVTESAPKNLKR